MAYIQYHTSYTVSQELFIKNLSYFNTNSQYIYNNLSQSNTPFLLKYYHFDKIQDGGHLNLQVVYLANYSPNRLHLNSKPHYFANNLSRGI